MIDSIDYFGAPKTPLDDLLARYHSGMYLILDEVLESKQTYRLIYQDLLDILKWGYEIKEIRDREIAFRFHPKDKEIQKLRIPNFLSNMILFSAFLEMDCVDALNKEFIFDFVHYDTSHLVSYVNDRILTKEDVDFYTHNAIIDDTFYHITAISNAFSLLIGAGFSIYSIYQAEKRNPEMRELMMGMIDPELQPIEIEAEIDRRTKRIIELLKYDVEDNDLKPLFLSGKKNLSEKQVQEILIKIGLKADIDGNTIPMLIDTNFLVTGLNKPSYVYINNLSGRKSLILTKTMMGIPGAFSKKLNNASTSVSILRKDSEPCDTAVTVDYYIRDEEFLRLLNGRNYYDARGNLKRLNGDKDLHLIGKVIPFRSPATCSSEKGICHTCYGHLSRINQDIFSIGALAATKESGPLGQSVLSSKHTQTTDSNEMKFSEGFDQVFDLSSTEVSLKENSDLDDELFILLDNVHVEETDDTDFYYTTEIRILDGSGNTLYRIQEQNESKMFLSDELLVLYKRAADKTKPINLDSLDSESPIFNVAVKNRELSDPIKIIQGIINSKAHAGATNVSELCQIFAEGLIDVGIRYNLVHAECIIRALLRKQSNPLEFPDWSLNGDHNDYRIMTLNDSLLQNPSPLVSMSYGYLRKQLIGTQLYLKRGTSHIDPFFVPDLPEYID